MRSRPALLLALAGAVLASSCGGPVTAEALFGEGDAYAMVRVEVPDGWHSLAVPGRLVLAESEEDLRSGGAAAGPRLVFEPPVSDPVRDAMAMLPQGSGARAATMLRILAEPEAVTFGDVPAVAVTIEDASGGVPFVRRYIVLSYAGTASLVVAEAPAERWEEIGPMLDGLLRRSLQIGS